MAFYPLEQLIHIDEGYRREFSVAGRKLLLIQHEQRAYLIENRCPHMDAPLSKGSISADCHIRCPAHGINFDLITGKASGALAHTLENLVIYPIVYEGSMLGVEI